MFEIDEQTRLDAFVCFVDQDAALHQERLKPFEHDIDHGFKQGMARRDEFPGMHVYHYASYEKTALQKLMQRHVAREREVDLILREELLVDLYSVVRQALVVGQPSYSIKKIEEYYGKRGDASGVKGGDESILQFEAWLATRGAGKRNDALLDDLRTYNEYDCVSTYGLRQWLLELRAKAAAELGVEIPPYAGKPIEPEKVRNDPHRELELKLEERLPADFVFDGDDPRFDAVRRSEGSW